MHSFRGGGFRGVGTLAMLNEHYPRAHTDADAFAGTSTGAIIAAGLAVGVSPANLLAFYKRWGSRIFASRSVWDRLNPFDELFARANYGHDGLEDALETVFGAETRMKDVGRPLYIATTNLCGRFGVTPKLFSSNPDPDANPELNRRLVEVLMASCSAPTYFPSRGSLVDGGLGMNNPAGAAVAQLMAESPGSTVACRDFGTGFVWNEAFAIDRDDSLDWSAAKWLREGLLDVIMEAASSASELHARGISQSYEFYDFELKEKIALDDVSAYDALVGLGRQGRKVR